MNGLFKKIQVTQNKFARFLAGTSLLDKMRTDKIFEDLKFLSVNQINAQIKLQEVWKSKNLKNYPLKWSNDPKRVDSRTRSVQTESLMVMGNGQKMLSTFHSDSARIWNHSPDQIKNCKTLFAAKKAIKQFVMTLPI